MARIIRGGAAVVDAEAEAARIVRDAEARAAEVLAEERARLEDEARALARVEGERARRAELDALAPQITRLALEVARRVVGEALAVDPDRVRDLVREALDRVRRASRVRVRVHPDDAPRLDGMSVEIVADGALRPGDCVVESELGDVDGRLEARFEAVERALSEASE